MLIFLYGVDQFRSSEKLTALKNKYLEKNSSGLGLSVLDFDEKIPENIALEAFTSTGLFSTKKLVLFLNCIKNHPLDQQKRILNILKNKKDISEDQDNIYIFWEDNSPKKNNSLFKYLEKNSKKQTFLPLTGNTLEKWVLDYAKKANPEIFFQPFAIKNLLLFSTGNNLYAIKNEIEKLLSYCENKKTITTQDVQLLVNSEINSNIFQAIESILDSNKKNALKLLHEQIEKGEDPFYIFSMFVYQFRNLLKIGDCYWSGNTNQYAIAKETGINPYVVQKTLAQLKKTTPEKLKIYYSKLSKIDLAIKTTNTDLILALDKFIVSI
jgi:DNA polymerase III delta subunit